MGTFKIKSTFKPAGDQPQAIEALARGLAAGEKHQTLLGVTGSGKTFTMAQLIARARKPTLVISPNKILAAQLYAEFIPEQWRNVTASSKRRGMIESCSV